MIEPFVGVQEADPGAILAMDDRGFRACLKRSMLPVTLLGAALTTGAGEPAALPLIKELAPATPLVLVQDGAGSGPAREVPGADTLADAPLAELTEALAAARTRLEQLNRAAEALAGAAALRAELAAKEQENQELRAELQTLRASRAEWQRASDAADAEIGRLGQALDEAAAEARTRRRARRRAVAERPAEHQPERCARRAQGSAGRDRSGAHGAGRAGRRVDGERREQRGRDPASECGVGPGTRRARRGAQRAGGERGPRRRAASGGRRRRERARPRAWSAERDCRAPERGERRADRSRAGARHGTRRARRGAFEGRSPGRRGGGRRSRSGPGEGCEPGPRDKTGRPRGGGHDGDGCRQAEPAGGRDSDRDAEFNARQGRAGAA